MIMSLHFNYARMMLAELRSGRLQRLSAAGQRERTPGKNRESESPRTERAAVRLVSTMRVGKPGCAGASNSCGVVPNHYVVVANCCAVINTVVGCRL